jgi:hypothetical protein
MIDFVNFETSLLLYLESGIITRSGTSLLLGICYTTVVIYLGFFDPYFDLPCFRSSTPSVSRVPLTI